MLKFYISIFKESLRITVVFLGLNSVSTIFRSVLLWVVSSLVVYVFFDKLLEDRIEIAISALLGLALVAFFSFFISLFVAQYRIYEAIVNDNDNYIKAISSAVSSELRIQELSNAYYQGKELYQVGFSSKSERNLWINRMDAWKAQVEDYLKKWFGVTSLHKFRDSGNGFHYTIESMEHNLSADDMFLLAKYSSNISHLNEIILFSSSGAGASLKTILEEESNKTLQSTAARRLGEALAEKNEY